MKDIDKLWLEFRLYVGDMHAEDISEYMTKISKNIKKELDETVKAFFIPVFDEASCIRLIYSPKNGEQHDYNQAKTYVDELKEKLKNEYEIL